jgi:hypothetical protein
MGRNLDVVNKWYTDFHGGYIDPVVSVYASDAVLTVGAGDSGGAVPYGGRFVGTDQIRNYYAWRFSMRTLKSGGMIRPFCGIAAGGFEKEFGPWVIVGGKIEDAHSDHSSIYNGPFLHVWSFDAGGSVTSLSMFFDNEAVM